MKYELAYDLNFVVDREVVVVQSDDAHKKVRLLITGLEHSGDRLDLRGHSLGSSVKGIRSAKKEEPPIVVQGRFEESGGRWTGTIEPAG